MTTQALKSLATRDKAETPLAKFSHFMDKLKPQLALALPKHMNPDRMSRLALTAFSTNPELQKCSTQSIAGSIMVAAQMGLEPGIGGQGYLVAYKGTCTFVPGWKGLVDLVARSGRATVWTGVVRPGDKFEYQLGDAPFCRHVPGDADEDERFTHVYAIGRVRDAQMPVIEVWTRAKIEKHLKQYNKVGGVHYAKANENNFEMYARKVALLQVLKYMPSSVELNNAQTISHAAEEGKSVVLEGDYVHVMDNEPDPTPATTAAAAAAAQAGNPTFDYQAAHQRIAEAVDREVLGLMADGFRDLPDSPDKEALIAAYRQRDAVLAEG
jgi:recombination protein RecT